MMFLRPCTNIPHLVMIWQKHIAAMGNSWLLLNETSKTCSSKISEPIGNQLFVGMMFVWSSTKILHFVLILQKTWPLL
jgi:hypothetical protein